MAAILNFRIFRQNCKTQKMLVSRKQCDRVISPKFLTHRHDYQACVSISPGSFLIMISQLRLPCMCACVRLSVRSSRFCINLNISFIYEDVFTKFARNVYGYENLSLKNFSLILKNKMSAIANCLKIVKVL